MRFRVGCSGFGAGGIDFVVLWVVIRIQDVGTGFTD